MRNLLAVKFYIQNIFGVVCQEMLPVSHIKE